MAYSEALSVIIVLENVKFIPQKVSTAFALG